MQLYNIVIIVAKGSVYDVTDSCECCKSQWHWCNDINTANADPCTTDHSCIAPTYQYYIVNYSCCWW